MRWGVFVVVLVAGCAGAHVVCSNQPGLWHLRAGARILIDPPSCLLPDPAPAYNGPLIFGRD